MVASFWTAWRAPRGVTPAASRPLRHSLLLTSLPDILFAGSLWRQDTGSWRRRPVHLSAKFLFVKGLVGHDDLWRISDDGRSGSRNLVPSRGATLSAAG